MWGRWGGHRVKPGALRKPIAEGLSWSMSTPPPNHMTSRGAKARVSERQGLDTA